MKTSFRLMKRASVLASIDTSACFNGSMFAGNSLVSNILGRGDHGSVYSACTPVTRVNGKVVCGDNTTLFAVKIVKQMSSHERTALEICLELVAKNVCPNFTILYGIVRCPQCPLPNIGSCSVFVTEYAHKGDLSHWVKMARNTKYIDNVMFQICCAVYALFKHGRRAHNDLHLGNILVHPVDAGGSWMYVVDGVTYYCPNIGVLVTLADFDKCRPATATLDHVRVAKLIRLVCTKIPDTTKSLLKTIESQTISQVFGLFGYTRKLPVIEQYVI